MKKNLILFLIFSLISCTSIKNGNIAPGYLEAFDAIKTLILGFDNKIDPEVISKIPYASMKVRIGNGPLALMILQTIDEEESTWVSADGVYLVIKKGKIIKTQGLPNNLFEKLTSFNSWQNITENKVNYTSYFSFREPELNNLKVKSVYLNGGLSKVPLTFETKELLLINERITSDLIGWNETNSYWLDQENFVWKSVQYVSPRLPPIFIEVTKKPQ